MLPTPAEWVSVHWGPQQQFEPLPDALLSHVLRVVELLEGTLPLASASQAELDSVFRTLVADPIG